MSRPIEQRRTLPFQYCQPLSSPSPYMQALEKAVAVALGVFAFSVNRGLFVPFFALGCLIGLYAERPSINSSCATSSCAFGLIENLTGTTLPKPVALVANVAAMVCHIEHHDTVFVPVVGVSLGNWAAREIYSYLTL